MPNIDALTWTDYTNRCQDCGRLFRASREYIAETRAAEGHGPDITDRMIASDLIFCLSCGGFGNGNDVPGEIVLSDWILRLTERFSTLMRLELGAENLEKVRALNAARADDTCASHDFTDANEVMCEAFWNTARRAPVSGDDIDNAVWNAAWDAAKASGFRS